MAKRSQRRLSRHEREQAGCIWGFISIFDFRHGRSTRRLLLDRRRLSKPAAGPVHLKTESADVAKTSVKELMEEEMFKEDIDLEQTNSKYGNETKINQKRRNRSRNKSRDMDVSDLVTAEDQVLEQTPSDDLALETIMEDIAKIYQRNHVFHGDDGKFVGALKLFIEQKMSSNKRIGEDKNLYCSKEFMDALRTLNVNNGSFLRQLEDDVLLKQIRELQDAVLDKDQTPANVSEEKPLILKPDELGNRKPRNFFRRRSKSMESYPLGGGKDQSPNKIVILKPGGAQSPETSLTGLETSLTDNKVENERNNSQFSFTEIKRKLRYAMGKERNGNINVDKGDFGWRSPNRNHFYTEKFTVSSPSFKKGEPAVKGSSLGASSIYVEAKKHLSEMLKNGDENVAVSRQLPKPLGRILSFPDYNGSPCLSPRYGDDIFLTSPMRLSPRSIKNTVNNNNNNHRSPVMQNLESQLCVSGSNSEDKEHAINMNINVPLKDDPLETQSSNEDAIVPQDSIDVETEPRGLGEEVVVNASSELPNDGDMQKEDTREELSPCCKLDLPIEADEMMSSPTMSPSHREIKLFNCAIEKAERPSPVSVLEPLFTDDDVSPPSTICQPVEKDIQPRHIHFEEQSPPNDLGICTRISLEGEESAFEYLEAVLLGSGLNWDEFLLRWLSTYEILDSSLFDEVELFSSRPHHDQQLLFDCANDALNEVCEYYFGCFTGISQGKPNIRTVPKGMDLINEIWRRVEWHLSQHSQPHSLDQLVKRDLTSCEKWMSIQSDVEVIGFEMEETIFNEVVEDVLLSFVDNDNDSDSDSECEFALLNVTQLVSN